MYFRGISEIPFFLLPSPSPSLRPLLRSNKVWLVGVVQAGFEAAMYIFVFLWTPMLDPHGSTEHPPLGFIFGTFMLAVIIGSWLFRYLLDNNWTVVNVMHATLSGGTVCLLAAFFFDTHRTILLWVFTGFEICCGLFFPGEEKGMVEFLLLLENSSALFFSLFLLPLSSHWYASRRASPGEPAREHHELVCMTMNTHAATPLPVFAARVSPPFSIPLCSAACNARIRHFSTHSCPGIAFAPPCLPHASSDPSLHPRIRVPLNIVVVAFLLSVSYFKPSYLFLGCAAMCGTALAAHTSLTRILAADGAAGDKAEDLAESGAAGASAGASTPGSTAASKPSAAGAGSASATSSAIGQDA